MPSIATLPDVQPNTHIIGLCGVNDYHSLLTNQNACDPAIDGWMLSDFYLFHHLFRGTGRSQAWFTCLDPEVLIRRHGEYVHGNCYRERRVVLDRHTLPDPSTLRVEEPDNLLPNFLNYLRLQCEVARAANEPVLLCAFCHGDSLTNGLEIGGTGEDGPLLRVEDISEVIASSPGIQICLLLTSCFSGGWTVTPLLRDTDGKGRATVMTAAGPSTPSESWPLTASLGRACGSIYTSAIISVLESEATREENREGQQMSAREFACTIRSDLLNIIGPRFGETHDSQFEVQNEQWEDPYQHRTGIPLRHYWKILQGLRVIPPRDPTDIRLDRSSTAEQIEAWQIAYPTAPHVILADSNYGGSMYAVKKAIRRKAIEYMESHPGLDSLAPNHIPHLLINRCIQNPHQLSEEAWSGLWDILHYRLKSIKLAENLVHQLGLQASKACRWDHVEWQAKNGGTDAFKQASGLYRVILESGIFPTPDGSRKHYDKPLWYLAVACVESGLPSPEIERRLEEAKHLVYETIISCAKGLKRTRTSSKVADTWITSSKRRVRTLSPSKRANRRSLPSNASMQF